jgi:hypothetical protein
MVAPIREEALRRGVAVLIALMPPLVARSVRNVGLDFRRVAEEQLKRQTIEQLRYLITYRDFFLPALRKQGLEADAERLLGEGDVGSLRRLLDTCDDEPHLYWIRTEDFVALEEMSCRS